MLLFCRPLQPLADVDADLKVVSLKESVSSSVGRGSRVDRMSVAPTANEVLVSGRGVRRSLQRVSVVQVQPAIAAAANNPMSAGPAGFVSSAVAPVPKAASSMTSIGTSRASVSLAVTLTATQAAQDPTPTSGGGPAVPAGPLVLAAPSAVSSSSLSYPSSELHEATAALEAPIIAAQPLRVSHVAGVAISNRFSASVTLGRTLVASDMTSTTPRKAALMAGHRATVSAVQSARLPVLLIDTVPRGSRCLESSPSAGSNRVLLPPLPTTPSSAHPSGGGSTPSRRTGLSTAVLPVEPAAQEVASLATAACELEAAHLGAESNNAGAVQEPTLSPEEPAEPTSSPPVGQRMIAWPDPEHG